jgi:predicted dehydrogenase
MGPTREAGPAMVVDSGSHPISMLQALVGPGTMHDARVTSLDRDRGRLDVAWRWVHARGEVEAELALTRHPAPPRPAGYAIDGRVADRRIDPTDYSMAFADGERRVPVPDPLVESVRDFARAAAEGRPPARRRLIEGMTALHELVAAVERGVA